MHRADPRAGQHRDRRFRNGRQVNDDAIAFADFVSLEHIREPADFAMQLLIGQGALLARFAFPDDRGLVPAGPCEMTIEAILRNVQFSADEPFRERRLPFENFLPRRVPDQLLRFARPEFVRLLDRFAIHPPILLEAFDPRPLGEIRCRLENAFFDQMRFDVVVHGQSLICARTFQGKRTHPL